MVREVWITEIGHPVEVVVNRVIDCIAGSVSLHGGEGEREGGREGGLCYFISHERGERRVCDGITVLLNTKSILCQHTDTK